MSDSCDIVILQNIIDVNFVLLIQTTKAGLFFTVMQLMNCVFLQINKKREAESK